MTVAFISLNITCIASLYFVSVDSSICRSWESKYICTFLTTYVVCDCHYDLLSCVFGDLWLWAYCLVLISPVGWNWEFEKLSCRDKLILLQLIAGCCSWPGPRQGFLRVWDQWATVIFPVWSLTEGSGSRQCRSAMASALGNLSLLWLSASLTLAWPWFLTTLSSSPYSKVGIQGHYWCLFQD